MTPTSAVTITPVSNNISLEPSSVAEYEFTIRNTADVERTFSISAAPYYASDTNYQIDFSLENNYTQLSHWISLPFDKITVPANSERNVKYQVNVPDDPPNGNQYAVLLVEPITSASDSIQIISRVGLILYGKSTGETVQVSKINNLHTDSIMFGGKIVVTSSVNNSGNVDFYGDFRTTICDLSDREVYSHADTVLILPDTEYKHIDTWEETPSVGIYRVHYTVSTPDVSDMISQVVIIFPIWLIVIIFLLISGILTGVILRIRKKHVYSTVRGVQKIH